MIGVAIRIIMLTVQGAQRGERLAASVMAVIILHPSANRGRGGNQHTKPILWRPSQTVKMKIRVLPSCANQMMILNV